MTHQEPVDHPLRLGILVSHPIQYFVPVYRELARRSEIDLTVIYRTRVGVDAYHDPGFGQTVQWDIPLLDGYQSCFLSDKTSLTGLELTVVRALFRQRFDVLMVHGYDSLTHLLAIVVAKLVGEHVLIRGDTRLQQRHFTAPFWKRLFKRLLFKVFDGFLTIGSLNREYYLAFGARPDRVFFAPFCVNNTAFALGSETRKEERRRWREAFGLAERCTVVLYAAKFLRRKRAEDLLHAFAAIEAQFPEAWLVLAGAGEMESSLRTQVADMRLQQVRFLGFQNQSVLPRLFAGSDLFVLPSEEEPWGLALNEAMAAGLPVIVSDEVGAVPDLVEGKGTGIVYRCGDVEALTKAMETLLESEALRAEMGKKAHDLIGYWDIAACASGVVMAVSRLVHDQQISRDFSRTRL